VSLGRSRRKFLVRRYKQQQVACENVGARRQRCVSRRLLKEEQLGAGTCGADYRAFDPALDRDVALKVPHSKLQRDDQATERFLRAANAGATLTIRVSSASSLPL
jgi:hypothetical protein